ncbi:MAG: GNAT family N-acetyltransferase [Chloroflexota bacterium]
MTDPQHLFANEREHHFPMTLPENIIGRQVEMATYFDIEDALTHQIFPDSPQVQRWFSLPKERREEKRRLYTLQRMTHQEAVIFYDGETPIGYSAGRMTGASEFMMDETGILPAYRRKGIYAQFLQSYLPYLKDCGYERLVSYHSPTNRPVLIAKLKAGFNISGMELREHAGASVKLVYFLHQDRLITFQDVHSLE